MHRGAHLPGRLALPGSALGLLSAFALLWPSCTHDFGRFEPDDGGGGAGGDDDGGEPSHCSNDVHDVFTETDVDCGGDCEQCDRGERCSVDEDCDSEHCANDVCCESACHGANRSCDEPGREGECVTPDDNR